MEEHSSLNGNFKYVRMHSATSINEILEVNDIQRLDHLARMFAKYQMTGKRYETKAWHAYFRRIAANPIIFYQNNAALFYEDNQYESENFEVTDPTLIHGDLHIGQFHYYLNDISGEPVFSVRQHKKKLAPFTWDLKRLAANLALIAYCQCFSDNEISEILEVFAQQYIRSVLLPYKNMLTQKSSHDIKQSHHLKPPPLQKQCSIIGSLKVEHRMHEIDWQSIDSVKSLMILAEQLAITTAHLHCQPPITVCSMPDVPNLMIENNADCCTRAIQTSLNSYVKQRQLIDEIRLFAIMYAEIAERDFQIFFKNFRNERIFKGPDTLMNTQIQHPLANARRVAILIIGGGIGGMATALSFARAGIRVRLLEKNTELGEVGAGMQLAPNCSRLLDRLGILQQVQANAVFPKQIVWMDALSGERLTCIDLGKKFVKKFGYPYIVVHRAD
ncbi:unnamed protein product, partial [Rotaria sordida]